MVHSLFLANSTPTHELLTCTPQASPGGSCRASAAAGTHTDALCAPPWGSLLRGEVRSPNAVATNMVLPRTKRTNNSWREQTSTCVSKEQSAVFLVCSLLHSLSLSLHSLRAGRCPPSIGVPQVVHPSLCPALANMANHPTASVQAPTPSQTWSYVCRGQTNASQLVILLPVSLFKYSTWSNRALRFGGPKAGVRRVTSNILKPSQTAGVMSCLHGASGPQNCTTRSR